MNEIILDLTTMILQIQMGEAKTTTEMDIDVSYVNDTVGTSRTGASQQSTTNGVTLATILSAPASGHVLVVKQILVTNKDTVVHTFKIWRVVSGGSNFEVFGQSVSIAVGATWDSSNENASVGNVVGPASATTGDIPTFNGTTGKIIQDSGILATNVVQGPASSTDGNISGFNGAGGKTIKDLGTPVAMIGAAIHTTSKSSPVFADLSAELDSASSNALVYSSYINIFTNLMLMPDGTMINGKISPAISSNDLVLSLVAANTGVAATATNPIFVKMNGIIYTVTAALSVTASHGAQSGAGTFNSGSVGLAVQPIDYFAYIGYNTAQAAVVLAASRIPSATRYGDFSATVANEKYAAISNTTSIATNDPFYVIGRFEATNGGTSNYYFTVPTYTPLNLIQRPIFNTRDLNWTLTLAAGTLSAVAGTPTTCSTTAVYSFMNNKIFIGTDIIITNHGSASSGVVITPPFGLASTTTMAGVENVNTGKMVGARITGGNIRAYFYDATTLWVDNNEVIMQATCTY